MKLCRIFAILAAVLAANLAKSQVLQKAGTAMLSQANASTQDILSLLK
ncbi:MAG TPA: hypothetical protein EYQ12_01205 [Oceanospirillaceae bacterium]|nr:hypothetical protein [Oceanospirillaceae bacterium]